MHFLKFTFAHPPVWCHLDPKDTSNWNFWKKIIFSGCAWRFLIYIELYKKKQLKITFFGFHSRNRPFMMLQCFFCPEFELICYFSWFYRHIGYKPPPRGYPRGPKTPKNAKLAIFGPPGVTLRRWVAPNMTVELW